MNLSDSGESRVDHQAGFLLHQRPYKDRSSIIEIFTHDWGRVGLVANGVRKEKSRLAGVLQPFQRLLFSWRGRGELKTLSSVEAVGTTELLQGHNLISALYLNELMVRLISRHDPHPMLFSYYHQTLQKLAKGEAVEWALREFERDLLQELGYGLNLSHDIESGEVIEPDAIYCYYSHGPIKLERNPESGSDVTLKGETLLALGSGEQPAKERLRETKRLMRAMLQPHLGEKPLMSRTLFQSGR